MRERVRFLLKNVGILTFSNFTSKILIFLLVPLYTSVLSTTEYGTYDLVVSIVTLLYPVLTANIADAVMRFVMDETYANKKVTLIGVKYVVFSIIVISVPLFLVNKLALWKEILGLEIYIALYYVFYVFNQFFIQLAKGLEKIADMGIASILGTITMVVSNLLFLLALKWGLPGFFVSNILAQAIPVIYFFFRLKFWEYIIEVKIDRNIQIEMLKYCVPLITTTLSWWINSTSDKLVVSFICGVAANGILSVSHKIPQIINTIQGIFIQAWQISAIKEYDRHDVSNFYTTAFFAFNLLMSVSCACLIILSKPLAKILYANDFYVAWQYVPFLLVSIVINGASGFLGPILVAKKDSKTMALSAIYGSVVNVLLNILLVFFIGIQGSTIATVISSFVIYNKRKKAIHNEIIFSRYYVVYITWLLLITQAIIEIYLPFWQIEILIMTIMLAINWSGVKEFLRVIFELFMKKN